MLLGINQSNLEERSQQVKMMREIYKFASRVAIYLGEETEGTKEALEMLLRLSDMSERSDRHVLTFPQLSHEWKHFQDFFERDWFRRLWVLQEVAVATKDPIVICGEYYIPWKHIRNASKFFYTTGLVRNTRRVDIAWNAALMGDCREYPEHFSLLQLLNRTILFKSTDPRDRLFALYGLAHDTQSPSSRCVFPIDYSMPVEDLYREFTRNYIEHSGKADILTIESKNHMDGLPSWVADFSSPAQQSHLGVEGTSRAKTSPEYRIAFGKVDGYRASGFHFALLAKSDNPDVLRICGSVADRVAWISEPFEGESIEHLPAYRKPGYFVRLWDEVRPRLEPALGFKELREAFWRTLIANAIDTRVSATDRSFIDFLCFWHEKRFLDQEAEQYAAMNAAPGPADPDHYGALQQQHLSNRRTSKQFAAAMNRQWSNARAKHPTECTGCNYCESGNMIEEWQVLKLVKDLCPVEGDDPMLEFKESDCFINEYFRRLNEDVVEPWSILLGDATRFCTSNIQAMRNRCMFITEKGQLGLGPRNMSPGDLVTVISGASMPLILREADATVPPDTSRYDTTGERRQCKVIGPAYIHGLMNGEGVPEAIIEVSNMKELGIDNLKLPIPGFEALNFAEADFKKYWYPWEVLDLV